MKGINQLRLVIALIVAALLQMSVALAQAPIQGRDLQNSPDPRVQHRTYHFADTNQELPYAVFVSSRVSASNPNPLIVNLHGLGVGAGFMLKGKLLELAEEQGYIVVGPQGYNVGGWYGTPVIALNNAPVEPANLSELSEKDVMNVLEMIRKEFNVDPNRTYLLGHSMGGAGTLNLGVKYAQNWAAIAAIAPAAFRLDPASLAPIKDTMPVMIVQGDADTLVPAENTRRWADYMKANVKTQRYIELKGADHGTVIDQGMADIFAWFAAHPKAK